MSKLITDAIELSGGTNLSLPTTRPDNSVLKITSNSLNFVTKPETDLKVIYDFAVDGAVSSFDYVFSNTTDTLAGLYIEFDGLQANGGETFKIRLQNSAGGSVQYHSSRFVSVGWSYGGSLQRSASVGEIPFVGTSWQSIMNSSATVTPAIQHTGNFYLLLDGKHSNLTQAENTVVYASMGISNCGINSGNLGPFAVHHHNTPDNDATNIVANHDAENFTVARFYLGSVVNGRIKAAEIPRGTS